MNKRIGIFIFSAALLSACGDETKTQKDSVRKDGGGKTMSVPDSAGQLQAAKPAGIMYNGDTVKRYPNGVIEMKGMMGGGLRQGQWVAFFPNGNVQSECQYKDNVAHGRTTVYRENGTKYWDGFYNKGRQVGKWKYWDEQGQLVAEKDYGGEMPK